MTVVRECCKRAMEGHPPCEPCRLLLESDAFSGVDARHDEYPRDRDPYEVMVESRYARSPDVEER